MKHWNVGLGILSAGALVVGSSFLVPGSIEYQQITDSTPASTAEEVPAPAPPRWPTALDRASYDAQLLALVDHGSLQATTTTTVPQSSEPATTTATTSTPTLVHSSSSNVTVAGEMWPPAAPYPHGGALLPFNRIVAYYGNFYSTRMGILGEFASSTVLARLAETAAAYEAADPDTPVLPAIHYIASVAQQDAGADGMYRNVMPDSEIEHAYDMAQAIDGILFIDLQIGYSTFTQELPKFRDFLERPDVHLAIDPEFAMPPGQPPGTVIGSVTAAEVNYVIEYLSALVREHELPPKVLVVHRFTTNMVQDTAAIEPTPEVQVVLHMDGWGSKELKRSTYRRVIEPEPIQFAGVKIFYKNDLKPPSTGLLTPADVLDLHPEPVYIQYQ